MDQRGSSSLIETASAATCLDQSFNITSAYTLISRTGPPSPANNLRTRQLSKHGRRSTSAAATGGAFQDSATKQITDIDVTTGRGIIAEGIWWLQLLQQQARQVYDLM
jgi:hypothetical protein